MRKNFERKDFESKIPVLTRGTWLSLSVLLGIALFFLLAMPFFWEVSVSLGFTEMDFGHIGVAIILVHGIIVLSVLKKIKGAKILSVIWVCLIPFSMTLFYFLRGDYMHAAFCFFLIASLASDMADSSKS